MVKDAKEKLKYIFFLLTGVLISNCANQLPPDGGEIDKIPPKIVEVIPADGTTNYNDDYFEIGFSEYVDKRSVKDAIFISPAVDGELELDWSGKYVRVYFPDTLKKNVTYNVTIGTDVVDYNNKNRMAEAFNFNFSTGNKIDRRTVTGKIYNDEPAGIMIFAYKKNNKQINPGKEKPDYISQTGTDGSYKLSGLAAGVYRIFAVKDEYRDLLFQNEQDMMGVPFTDVSLSETDSIYSPLNFFLAKYDTTAPRLFSAVMTDKNHLLVNFSKQIDSNYISVNNFSIVDSTDNKKIKPVFVFKGNTKPTEIVLVTNYNFTKTSLVSLIADSIKDVYGNLLISDTVSVSLNDKPDTTRPGIYKTDPPGGSNDVDFSNPEFKFYFDDAFDTSKVINAVSFSDTLGKSVLFNLTFLDDATLVITPKNNLDANRNYIIKINLEKYKDIAGNSLDSTYEYRFKTISGLDFTGVFGVITDIDSTSNPYVVLQSVGNVKKSYKKKLKPDLKISFERIIPGKYLLWSFLDTDSSAAYSYGKPYPFIPSEKFSFYPDTLNLRARWSVTDINFKFK